MALNMLTDAQVDEAIEQMKSHCKLMEETMDYSPISARGTLTTLGYLDTESVRQILEDIAARGFDYCLDPWIVPKTRHFADPLDDAPAPPPTNACYWGPDQLRSRLDSLRRR